MDSARTRLLGVEVDLMTSDEMLQRLAQLVAEPRVSVIANHNAHSVYLHRKVAAFRAFYESADLVEVDSRPMIAWGRLMGLPVRAQHRCTYLDWRDDFWRLARDRGWRVFYLGGLPGVAELARGRLLAAYPGLIIDVHDGYFEYDGAENEGVLQAIASFGPDIVLVGMGMPRQEAWIQENRARFARGVFFPIGAAFDYEAGVQRPAPRWIGRMGFEWLYRLSRQPRRLAFRYLVEPWFLLPAAAADVAARFAAGAGPVGARSPGG